MTKKIFSAALRVAISLGVIGFICWSFRSKFDEALVILKTEVIWGFFLVAAGTYLTALLVQAVRLKWVLKIQNISVNFFESFYLNCIGLFFNLFLPSAVGGDMVKAWYLYKLTGKKVEVASCVLVDRLLGFIALSIMAVTSITIYSGELNNPQLTRLIYFFAGGMTLLLAFISSRRFARIFGFIKHALPKKAGEKLRGLYHVIYDYKNHRGLVLQAIMISMICQSLFITVYFWLAKSLSVDISIFKFFILVPLVTVASMAPSLGGLGVREAGVIYFFKMYMPQERALALSVLLVILIYGFSILSGIAYALRGGLKSNSLQEMEKMS